MNYRKKIALIAITLSIVQHTLAQEVPSEFEHIEFLETFGANAEPGWGDDDHVQTFFFIIPKSYTKPVYLRVYDPDTGGKHDEPNNDFNTKTKFSIYAGQGAHAHPDAQRIDPVGNYKSGNLIHTKIFGNETKYDQKWYTFGPFNPLEGEESDQFDGYVFKIIAEGLIGDDGNLYKYFLSVNPDNNKEVEGSNAFTYEYSIRLPEAEVVVTHLYPFLDDKVESFTQHNFDFDGEGKIFIYSLSKNRHVGSISSDETWAESKHMVTEEERNTTIDIQIVKVEKSKNDMVLYLKNQYGDAIAFFSSPIGGPPKYKYKVNLNYH
jgi:hypothetical protein